VTAIFHHEADDEFQSAIEHYQGESLELGVRFYREVLVTLVRIQSHPKAWPRLRGSVRKSLVRDFPYKILYTTEGDRIFVVALMHTKRRPGYWAKRLTRK
jgi:toxin ParE1/3/4